jgi:hypothetical protein
MQKEFVQMELWLFNYKFLKFTVFNKFGGEIANSLSIESRGSSARLAGSYRLQLQLPARLLGSDMRKLIGRF